MAVMSSQSNGKKRHLQEGAIFRDRSNNVVRLLSVCGDYCIYVYVCLTNNLRSSMHGSVTGRKRSDVFGADFVFVADSVEDWIGNQGKQSNRQSMSPWLEPRDWPVRLGIVSRSSRREHTTRRAS
jgi:hypothetical protein